MAAGRESGTLQRLAQLSQEHEIVIAKRQALLQMQKHKELEVHSRYAVVLVHHGAINLSFPKKAKSFGK